MEVRNPALHEIERQMFGPRGGSLPSLFVEFCEKVEEDLLARTRYIEELHFDFMNFKAMTSTVTPFVYPEAEKKQ